MYDPLPPNLFCMLTLYTIAAKRTVTRKYPRVLNATEFEHYLSCCEVGDTPFCDLEESMPEVYFPSTATSASANIPPITTNNISGSLNLESLENSAPSANESATLGPEFSSEAPTTAEPTTMEMTTEYVVTPTMPYYERVSR